MTADLVQRLDTVASTMDLVHRLGEEGAPAGAVVVAAEQTAGRGARRRAWHSARGGLWLSLLVRPTREGADLLSLRAGLALADALEAADPGLRLAIKWPNDLLWGGRKLGGVLCEVRWLGDAPAWAAVGVGINVANQVPPGLAATTARLCDRWTAATPDEVLELVLPSLRAVEVRRGRLDAQEVAELARRDWLWGRPLAAPLAGVADGISSEGALLVRQADGTAAPVRTGSVAMAARAGMP